MAILGHPLYAGGRYQGDDDAPFAALCTQLLREHHVAIVMAGDTHYFEHYRETYPAADGTHTYRPALCQRRRRRLRQHRHAARLARHAVGPRRRLLSEQGDGLCEARSRNAGVEMAPLVLDQALPRLAVQRGTDVRRLRLQSRRISQSFVEVKVERSANRVRLVLHSAAGPVKWRRLDVFGSVRPSGASDDDVVEFVVPLER